MLNFLFGGRRKVQVAGKFAYEDCCVLLRTWVAHRLSLQNLAAGLTPKKADLFFFLSTAIVFCGVRTHFPTKNTDVYLDRDENNEEPNFVLALPRFFWLSLV